MMQLSLKEVNEYHVHDKSGLEVHTQVSCSWRDYPFDGVIVFQADEGRMRVYYDAGDGREFVKWLKSLVDDGEIKFFNKSAMCFNEALDKAQRVCDVYFTKFGNQDLTYDDLKEAFEE